jgi:hypothetical protein
MPDNHPMPDWRQRIQEHLDVGNLPLKNREEVIQELAAHLEETYAAACSRGMTEAAAVELTQQEVNDWHVLAAKIRHAKSEEEPMNHRTKSFWLPAMLNLLAAMGLLMLMQRMGMQPRLIWIAAAGGQFAMVFYFPWLMTLPLLGAAGAYLARRTQAETMACLAAGLSPGLTLTALIALFAPLGLFIDGLSVYRLLTIAAGLLTWGVLPSIALLLGALPFLKESTLPTACAHQSES